MTWQWQADNAPLFDTGDVDDYAVCLYGGASAEPALLLRAVAAGDRTCGAASCWTRTDGSLAYRDPQRTSDGLRSIAIGSGTAARITVKAQGTALPVAGLPFTAPILVQLQASGGRCWEAQYGSADVIRNDGRGFLAKPHR